MPDVAVHRPDAARGGDAGRRVPAGAGGTRDRPGTRPGHRRGEPRQGLRTPTFDAKTDGAARPGGGNRRSGMAPATRVPIFHGWRVVGACFVAAVFPGGFGAFGTSATMTRITTAPGRPGERR